MSLRSQLALLIAALVLGATALFGALSYRASEQIIRGNALRAVQATAEEREEALRRRLQGQRTRAAAFLRASARECGPGGPAPACLAALRVLRATEGFAAAVVTRPGAPAAALGPGAAGLAAAAPPPGQLARFGFHATGRPFLVIGAADAAGAVLVLRWDDLAAVREVFAERAGLGESGETFLADPRGFFVTPPRHASASGQSHPIAAVPMKRCLAGQSAAMLAPDYRGAPVIHAFRHVEFVGGGCIMAHIQQGEAFAPVRSLGRRVLGLGLALGALALLASAWLARTVTRPVLRLREAAEGLARGEPGTPVPLRGPAEVRALAESFTSMARSIRRHTRELESANRAKSQFLAMMSHEIRTPINAVIGYTDLMEMGLAGPLTPQQETHLGRIRASSRHLLALINDVLDFSKVEAGEMEVWSEPTPLRGTAAAALELVAPQAAAGGVELAERSECDAEASYVGDADRVRQILVNLLSNAVKFTPSGGRVTVRCRLCPLPGPEVRAEGPGPWATFEVEDTGSGIAPEQLERIFEPFTQVEEGHTRSHGGTGLGLTISRRFARLMGGDLTVRSTPGEGSRFTLWLPAAPGAVSGPGGAGWPTRPREIPGLSALGDLLNREADALVARLGERLRSDPAVPGADGLDRAQLEDHVGTFLTDLGKTLVTLDEGGAEPELLRDGMDIKRLIAARHGEQRARMGWSADELRREYRILWEEIEALVARESGGEERRAALEILRRLMERAERISLESHPAGSGPGR
jgi:signal transduction histidine kinase